MLVDRREVALDLRDDGGRVAAKVSQREVEAEVEPAGELGAVVHDGWFLTVRDGEDTRPVGRVLDADQFVEAALACLSRALKDDALISDEQRAGVDGG
jgi:hypothetical protein